MTANVELGPAGRPFADPVVFADASYETTPRAVDRGFVVVLFLVLVGLAVAVGLFAATGQVVIGVGAALALPVLALLLRYPFAGVILWVIGVPFVIEAETITPHPGFWVLHRMMIPTLLGLVLVYHAIGQIRSRLKPTFVDWAILAFLGLAIANILLLSDNPSRMLMAFYDRLGVPLLLFWLVRAISPGERDLKRLAIVGAIVVTFQAAIGFLSWVAPSALPAAWLGRAGERTVGTFGGPAEFTVNLVFFSLLAAHYALTHGRQLSRPLLLAIVGFGMFGVFLSFQRGGWLGALVGFTALWLVHRGAVTKMAIVAAFAGAILAAGPLGAEFQYASERLSDADTVDSRLVTFDAALQMVEEQPIRGFGYGQFEKFDEQYKRSLGDVAFEEGGSLHNAWLGLAAENGIPAVVLFVLPAILLGIRSARQRHALGRNGFLGIGLLLIMWGAVLDIFIVSNTMDMLHSGIWGTSLAWLGLGLIAVQLEQAPAHGPRPVSRIMSGNRRAALAGLGANR
jgi:O-antigen ligase